MVIWKICKICIHSLTELVATRGHMLKLAFPPSSSNVRSRSFSVRCVGMWNVLPAEIVQLTDITPYKQALTDLVYDEFLEFD